MFAVVQFPKLGQEWTFKAFSVLKMVIWPLAIPIKLGLEWTLMANRAVINLAHLVVLI